MTIRVITEDSASGAQVIDGSLRFDSGKSHYLNRTPGSAGNRKTWTWSGWVKRSKFGNDEALFSADNSNPITTIRFSGEGAASPDGLRVFHYAGSFVFDLTTTVQYRDPSAWYHVVVACDTTQATTANRLKIYVNGTQVTAFDTATYPSQNYDTAVNNTVLQTIGTNGTGGNDFNGYVSAVYLVDGQALGPEYFGYTDPLTNTWRPKKFKPQATPNDGTVWSSNSTGVANDGTSAPANAFDGNLSTQVYSSGASNHELYYDIPNLKVNSTVRVFIEQHSQTNVSFYVIDTNDVKYEYLTAAPYARKWVDIAGVAGKTIKRIGAQRNGNGHGTAHFAWEIDGVILLDDDITNMGKNAFYLPMDGNSPIGEDKSGNGNNWTPVNFGGSAALDKATGALPILNTDGGGKVARVGVRTDAYYDSLVLALPLVGSNADVSNQINSGSTTKTITANGNAAASSAQSNFYDGSYYFDGTGDYLSIPNNTDFAMSTGDFTAECWIYTTSYSNAEGGYSERIFDSNTGQLGMYVTSDGSGTIGGLVAGSDHRGNGKPKLNGWSHVALTRSGSTVRIFLDGVLDSSFTNSGSVASSGSFLVGARGSGSGGFIGYIQDFRIYKGVAKYTSNFIPASTNPDILPDTPSGVSYSSNLTKITDGAVAFDGSGDYLSLADSDDWNFGSGDWTIEFYGTTKATTNGELTTVVTQSIYAASSDTSFYIGMGSYVSCWLSSGTTYQVQLNTSGVVVNDGNWHHIACVRNGTNIIIFVDGKNVANTTVSAEYTLGNSTQLLGIGSQNNNYFFPGFISNLRIIKGTALYTSNFTPPTRALTAVANTKLLCCQSNTSAGSAAVSPTVTDNYSAGVSLTATPYADIGGSNCTITNNGTVTSSSAGTNSFGLTNAADMTGTQRVDINMGNVSSTFFQSAWTLEMFFKTSNTNDNWFVGSAESGNVWQTGWSINAESGNIKWNYDSPGGGTQVDTGISISTNTWYFMRVQRTPGTSTPLAVWVYSSPTSLLGSYSGTVSDTSTHTLNVLKIGDANGNSNNLNGNWQFANVMITAGTVAHQNVPSLSGGVRTDSATVSSEPILNGNAAATNFNPFTSDINAVRGQESGYATWNPLEPTVGTLSNGNLKMVGSSAWKSTKGTVSVSSGKWYYEGIVNGNTYGTALGNIAFGIGWYTTKNLSSNVDAGTSSLYNNLLAFHNNGGYNNFATWQTSVTSLTAGDVIGIALNKDNNTFTFYKNGVSVVSGTLANTTDDLSPWINAYYSDSFFDCNFGQKPFKFPPPEGFLPLNAAIVRPSTVIARPDQYFDTVLFNGNGTSQSITGLNFKPDFVWIKDRSSDNNYSHRLVDSVRGSTRVLFTDSTNGTANEQVDSYGTIDKFTDNGFDLRQGTGVASGDGSNTSGSQMVAWCWKAGGDAGTFNVDGVDVGSAAAAGLSGKNITPTACSIGTKQGFSIIKYTGNGSNNQTVPHGLTQAPTLIMTKSLNQTGSVTVSWGIFHKDGSFNNKMMYFTQNAAQAADTNVYTTTSQTDEHFTIGTWTGINQDGTDYISYIWHDVPGLFKTGLYTGNGSTDGPVLGDMGFSPNLVFLKRATGGTGNWVMIDSKRPGYNPEQATLCANLANDENASGGTTNDFLSNGLKIRGTTDRNASGNEHIYFAWAEAPTFNLYGAQSNAR